VEQYPKLSSHPSSVADVQKLPLFTLPAEKKAFDNRERLPGCKSTFHGRGNGLELERLVQTNELHTDRAARQQRLQILKKSSI